MIRLATLDDVPAIVQMAEAFAATPEYASTITLNPEAVASLAAMLIENPEALLLVDADPDVPPVGMIALVLTPHLMSGELLAIEVVWWVDPSARGIGVQLLREAEQWAAACGAHAIQLIAPSARVERFYELVGYRKIESAFQKRLN